MRCSRRLALALAPFLLAACAPGALGGGAPREVVGLLSSEGLFGFIPCDAPADDAFWRIHFSGRASQQVDHLRNTGLLNLPQPLLVSVSGQVSEPHQRGAVRGGYTRTITISDIRGMRPSGTCEARGERLTPVPAE
jgi:hypothetical protein